MLLYNKYTGPEQPSAENGSFFLTAGDIAAVVIYFVIKPIIIFSVLNCKTRNFQLHVIPLELCLGGKKESISFLLYGIELELFNFFFFFLIANDTLAKVGFALVFGLWRNRNREFQFASKLELTLSLCEKMTFLYFLN